MFCGNHEILCRDFDGDVKEIFLVNMLLWEKEKVLR
jgi:hypothetical protein